MRRYRPSFWRRYSFTYTALWSKLSRVLFSRGWLSLDPGRFRVPTSTDERAVAIEIEEHELDALLDGIEVSTPDGPPQRRARKPRTH